MTEIIIQNLVEIAAALLMALIGVLGAWLSMKLAKRSELQSLNAAVGECVTMARLTVDELQQTVVDNLKLANSDGRLTKDEVKMLGEMLLEGTARKLSQPAIELMQAASVDIKALIRSAGEAWIREMQEKEGK